MGEHHHRRERWLHARISENLDEALKREARRRRSPVSLVVRNALETALDLVEELVEDGMEIARRSQRLARGGGRRSLDDIYGWQDVILNRDAVCAECSADLAVGAAAYRGLRDRPRGPAVFLCVRCLDRLRRTGRGSKNESEEDES